jgi:peptide-methionine (S)-S-oxide reductase
VEFLKHRVAERAIHLAPAIFTFDGECMTTEKATFGAGCFWGVEATFRAVPGVTDAAVGYAGGTTKNPTYEDVCSHATGHAEVVQVEFDPAVVSYDHLLDVFWANHNPTTLNRQGPDVGDQYRSVIFYHSPEQQAAAEVAKARLDKSGRFKKPIVTFIEPAPTFYRAEDYHQRYLEKRGLSHCAI